MKRTYEVRDRADKRAIREFLKREGQFLLPMLDLVEQTEVAIAEVIQVMGRATIEAVLEMSAEGVAGVKQAGRSRAEDDTVWYGRQGGVVYLSDRKVRVERPRLRRRGAGEGGEVEVPAYVAMRRPGAVADRMLEVLMAGVSTRKYGRVIGEMADTVGVSKSAVSRETVEASERVLKELMERRLDAWDLLVIYLDGIQMGSHHVLAAVGVDSDGKKHVLGVREGASENAEVTSALLEDLVERGLDPGRRRLFVIDGSKALRKAIEKVFGQRHPIQRCRNHKLRNVLGHLPKDQHAQVKAVFRAAMKLDAKEGEQKLEQLARWLERDHPSAAASLREGLSEMFTINRLGLPPRLRKCPRRPLLFSPIRDLQLPTGQLLFDRRRVMLVPLERFIAEGDAVLREICGWLGVDPAAMPEQAAQEAVNTKPAVFRQQGPFQRWLRRMANTPSWLSVRPLVPRLLTRPLGRFARGGRERSTFEDTDGVADFLRPRLQEDAAELFELYGEDFSAWWPTLFPPYSSSRAEGRMTRPTRVIRDSSR